MIKLYHFMVLLGIIIFLIIYFLISFEPTSIETLSERWSFPDYSNSNKSTYAQIVLLGMPGAPTSTLSIMLQEMGIIPHDIYDNSIVKKVNDEIWERLYQNNGKKKGKFGLELDLLSLNEDQLSEIHKNLSSCVEILNYQRPWVIKDPRLSLLLPLWKQHLDNMICIFVYSNPISLYKSTVQNNEITPVEWLSLWFNYTLSSLFACGESPSLIISHEKLIKSPSSEITRLYFNLKKLGPNTFPLFPPTTSEPNSFFENGKSIEPIIIQNDDLLERLGKEEVDSQKDQLDILKKNNKSYIKNVLTLPSRSQIERTILSRVRPIGQVTQKDQNILGSLHRLVIDFFENKFDQNVQYGEMNYHQFLLQELLKVKKNEAYVTLLTSSDEPYVAGALVLMESILQVDKTRDRIVLILEDLPQQIRDLFRQIGCRVILVQQIEEYYFENSEFCLSTRMKMVSNNKIKRWGRMFTKLRVWQLVNYSRIIYLDTDTIAFPSISSLFQHEGSMVAEGGKYHSGFNAGFMVVEPSNQTFDSMISILEDQKKTKNFPSFKNQVDCTEQAFLNDFFPSFRSVHVGRPDEGKNSKQTPISSYNLAHWITLKCQKPWSLPPCRVPKNCNRKLYQYWWEMFGFLDLHLVTKSNLTNVLFWEDFKKRNSLKNICKSNF